jgi:hypothetical protein
LSIKENLREVSVSFKIRVGVSVIFIDHRGGVYNFPYRKKKKLMQFKPVRKNDHVLCTNNTINEFLLQKIHHKQIFMVNIIKY